MQLPSRHAILSRGIILAGVVLVAGQLLPVFPQEHTLVLVRKETDSVVRRVDLSWTRDGAAEPHGGVTLTFPAPGGAPPTVRQSIVAPSGYYLLNLTLEHEAPNAKESGATKNYIEHVELQGSVTKVYIEGSEP